jgi:hypothetical protein
LIKKFQSKKRARLVCTGVDSSNQRQFELVVASQNQMKLTESGDEPSVEGEDHASIRRFELQFSISEVLNSVRSCSKKHVFLMLLLGQEHAEFSEWLQRHKIARGDEDNVDVQQRVTAEAYTKHISDYLMVSGSRVENFLRELRSRLAV